MKNIRKILNIILFVLLLIPASVSAQETTYTTPKYTKVYGNQVKNLEDYGEEGTKVLRMSDLHALIETDGFMVKYKPNIYNSNGNDDGVFIEFHIWSADAPVLGILYKGKTLVLRRYIEDNMKTYIDYTIFDQMFYENQFYPILKIYITADFIWIENTNEDEDNGEVRKNTHIPIFWGIGSDDYRHFAWSDRGRGKILLKKYNSSDDEDIQIYKFTLSKLIKDLK